MKDTPVYKTSFPVGPFLGLLLFAALVAAVIVPYIYSSFQFGGVAGGLFAIGFVVFVVKAFRS